MTKFIIPNELIPRLDTIQHGSTIRQRGWITTNDLIYISQVYKIELSELTKNLQIYIPPPPKSSYTPEFAAQLAKLKIIQQEQEYQELINKGNYKFDKDYISPSEFAKEVKNQITTIVNILVSVLSVVYAIWYWTDNYQFNQGTRVLLCLFFGILILVAEVVVFNSYIRKIDEAKIKESKKKEIKKIIETVVIN